MISFTLDIKDSKVLSRLADEFPVVAYRSLNRVIKSAKTEASRSIRETYNIKKKDVDPFMQVKTANRRRLIAQINFSSARIPIIDFITSSQANRSLALSRMSAKKRLGKQIPFSIKKGSRKTIPGAFVADVKSGHRGFFQRAGKSRLPMKEQKTISAAEMFGSKKVMADIQKHVDEKLPAEFYAQLKYYLSK